jgi:hypothetical protein
VDHEAGSYVVKYVFLIAFTFLVGCPPPQIETGRVCNDGHHNTCGTCVSTRACVWCESCRSRDPSLGPGCGDLPVTTVTEGCDLLNP